MNVEGIKGNISGTDMLSSFSILEYTNTWANLILGLPDLSVRREVILDALYSFSTEIIQPFFIYNFFKSALVSYHLKKSMNVWLMIAAGMAMLLELPEKGNPLTICTVCLTIVFFALENRFLTFVGLSILICLLESMITILGLFFCICLITIYHEIISEMPNNNDTNILSYFLACVANIYFIRYYFCMCGITNYVWYMEAVYVQCMISYVYFYGWNNALVRLHAGFIFYFLTAMVIIQLPFGKFLDLLKILTDFLSL